MRTPMLDQTTAGQHVRSGTSPDDEVAPEAPTGPNRSRRSAPKIRAGWSWRPTLWQTLRLELAVLMTVLAALDVVVDSSAFWLVVVVLVLSSVPLPNLWDHRRRSRPNSVPPPTEAVWTNPLSAALPAIESISEVPASFGSAVAVVDDADARWAVVSVEAATPRAPLGVGDVVTLFEQLAARPHDFVSMQLVVAVRDVPVEWVVAPAASWEHDPTDAAAAIDRSVTCTLALRLARTDRQGAVRPSPFASSRPILRRALLDVDDVAAAARVRCVPISRQEVVPMRERQSVGPEVTVDELGPGDPPPDEEYCTAWRFGDRHHSVYEVRRCALDRLGELVDLVGQTDTIAAAVSLRIEEGESTIHVPPRRATLTSTIRLTHVDADRLSDAQESFEIALDDLNVSWHRLDGRHREGYAASTIGGPPLSSRRPRLSAWSLAGRSVRRSIRARRERNLEDRGTPVV